MSFVFVNRPSVKSDIIDAVEYYKKISPKLAKQFLYRIAEAKIHIGRVPFGFRIRYKNVRMLLLKQFSIIFIILLMKIKSKLLLLPLFIHIETRRIIL
jgi:hypothetical protein